MLKRENNYDLLRIIASIAIVSLHVSASYLAATVDENVFGYVYSKGLIWSCIYNGVARFAVPCFIMLAGAFALSNGNNSNYMLYYRKILKKIYIPTFVFSFLYIMYSVVLVLLSNHFGGNESLLDPIINALKGIPFSHLWYLYMMIGVYFLVPVIIRVKQTISKKNYIIVATILMIASSLGFMFSTNEIKWDPGFSVRYVPYFLFGDIIRTSITENKKSKWKAMICLFISCVLFLLISIVLFIQKDTDSDAYIKLVDPLCPWVIVASLLFFCGFSYLSIKKNFSKIASLTFYIYLVHAGVWSVILLMVKRMWNIMSWNNAIIIPIAITFVFFISCIIAQVFELIQKI